MGATFLAPTFKMVSDKTLVISRLDKIQQIARNVSRQVLVADEISEAVDIMSITTPDMIMSDCSIRAEDVRIILNTSCNNRPVSLFVIGGDVVKPSWLAEFPNSYYLNNAEDSENLTKTINEIIYLGQAIHNSPATAQQASANQIGETEFFFADELAMSVTLAGKSRALHNVLKMIRLVAESNCNPILITGETGTGKELAAKAIHILRHPKEQFVAVNCAALTANLLESELFGHVKGAFTSADKDKTGLLELAGDGTVFLDEISEIPLELQAKLLRVLQEKTFRKVGGLADISFKASIIATSNRDLRREVKENRFRSDLYYRLNICPIKISPLRDPHRKQDIRLLANYFLKTSTISPAKIGKINAFTELAMQKIEKHSWPGNIRELRNVVERSILLETTDKIGISSIHIEPLDYEEQDNEDAIQARENEIISSDFCNQSSDISGFSLEKAERELIARALQESGWQKTRAAALLGITRATLYAKVKQHNIQREISMLQPCFK